jgi:chromosomal replication initiation ATPase DnaA
MTRISVYAFPGIRDVDLPDELIQRKVSALKEIPGVVTHDIISEAVKEVLGLDFSKFKSVRKDRPLVEARMMYIYYARTYMNWSLKELGAALGRDHTTIMHSIESFRRHCEDNPEFKIRANRIALLIRYKSNQLASLELI